MKSKILFFLALSLVVLTGCPPSRPPCIEILHLSFDGNTFDSSIYHHSVKVSGPVHYVQNRFAQFNTAIAFDGATSLAIPDTANIHFTNASSFTISTWLRTRDTNDVTMIGKGPANNAVPGYQLGLKRGRPNAMITATGKNVDLTGAKPISDNVWHLLTLTATPTEVTLYVDTTIVGHITNVHLVPDSLNDDSLRIGRSADGHNYYLGYLDQIIIRPCLETQVQISNEWRSSSLAQLADLPPGITIYSPDPDGNAHILGMCWVDSSLGYCCGTMGTIEKTTDKGITWTSIQNNFNNAVLRSISFDNTGNGVAVGDEGVILTISPNGTISSSTIPQSTLNQIISDPNYAPVQSDLQISDVKVFNSQIIIVGSCRYYSGGHAFVLVKINGNPWSVQTPPITITSLKCIATNGTDYWVAGEEGEMWMYQSSAWTQQNLPSTLPTSVVRCCNFNSTGTNALAGTSDGLLYSYASSSGSWNQVTGVNMGNSWIFGVADNGTRWAASDGNSPGVPGLIQKSSNSIWAPVNPSSNPPLWVVMSAGSANGIALIPYPGTPQGTSLPINWLN